MPRLLQRKFTAVFVVLFMLFLVACSTNSGTQSVQSVGGGNRNQLIVYVVGFTEKLVGDNANPYGTQDRFYQKNGIQLFLAGKSEFQKAQTMVFSYAGFTEDGKPKLFGCTDTTNNKIEDDARLLHDQINAYLSKHKNTDVYIIGHSLGGVIAFAYLSLMVEGPQHSAALENGGFLRGVSINDSPLGGVSSNWGYSLLASAFEEKACLPLISNATALHELQQLYTNAPDKTKLGQSASIVSLLQLGTSKSNQDVAKDAVNDGVTIIVIGLSSDMLWQPNICLVSSDFMSTEYLSDLGKQGSGALYVRSFWILSLASEDVCGGDYIKNSHIAVVTQDAVKQAIWEAFTNLDVHSDALFTIVKNGNGIIVVLTPIPTPSPTRAPQAGLTTGTWTGTTVINNNVMPVVLVVESVTGSSFTGTWTAGKLGPGNSASQIQEGVTYGNVVNFKLTTQVMGQVDTYGGTITGSTMSGNLVTYDNQVGTFTLTKN